MFGASARALRAWATWLSASSAPRTACVAANPNSAPRGAPDVLAAVDAPVRDVACGPSVACASACDEARARCATCAGSCQRGCDVTGTACGLTCAAGADVGAETTCRSVPIACVPRCPAEDR